MKRKVYKLIDRSVILATEIEETETTVTIKSPLSVTQAMNPHNGQPEIVLIPMDLIFGEVKGDKNTATFKKEHIMYDKPMEDFPAYEQNYGMQVTGVETVKKSGIIK